MIFTNNILAIPFLLLIWTTEFFLFVIVLRLTLAPIPSFRSTRFVLAFRELVDPMQQALSCRFTAWWQRPVPVWVSWLALIIGLILLRQLLAMFVTSIF